MAKKRSNKNKIPLSVRRARQKHKLYHSDDKQVDQLYSHLQHFRYVTRQAQKVLEDRGHTIDSIGTMLKSSWEALKSYAFPDSACKQGCAYCCHIKVECSIPEVVGIFYNMKMSTTPDMLENIAGDVREFVKNPVQDPAWWRKEQAACMFLHPESKSCCIYEFRPLRCRGWNSADVSTCRHGYECQTLNSQSPVGEMQFKVADIMATGIAEGCRRHGLESFPVELFSALNVLLSDSTAMDRWLSGEDVFKSAQTDSVVMTLEKAEEMFKAGL